MVQLVLVVVFGVGIAGCVPSRAASQVRYEVSVVAAGGPVGTLVVVTEDGGSESRLRQWTLDERGRIATDHGSPLSPAAARAEDCVGTDCYRVVPGELRVEESHDSGATYTTAWQITDRSRARLAKAYGELGDPAIHLSSRSVVVRMVAGGHVVFVANGRDGVLYRDVHGGWRRLGIPMGGEGVYFQRPARLGTEAGLLDPRLIVAVMTILVVLLAGGIAAAVRRRLPPLRAAVVVIIAGAAGAVARSAAGFPDVGMFPGYIYGGMIIVLVLACAAGLAVVVIGTAHTPMTPSQRRPGRESAGCPGPSG